MDKEDSRYKEYTDHFSEEVSEDIKKYAIDDALKFSRYMFIEKRGKQQFGYCTHCKAEFKTEGLRHNEETFCPSCSSKVTVHSSGMGRKYMVDNVYFVYYEKSIKDPNVLIARGIQVERDYRFDYHNIKTQYLLRAMYIFDSVNHKSTMLKQSYYSGFYEQKNSIFSLMGPMEQRGARVCYSRESIEKAVKGTPFKYSTWENYYHKDMTDFFNLYTKYPCIEYLTKEGCEWLVEKKLDNHPTYRTVNWRGKTIFKILKLNKLDLKQIKAKKLTITFSFLKVLQDAKKRNWNLTIEETVNVAEEYLNYYDALLETLEYSSMKKLLNYFSKQYKNDIGTKKEKHYYRESSVLTTFRDYIKDCLVLDMDILKDQVIFPKDIYTAHQNTIKQIKMQKDKKLDFLIKDRVEFLKKYIFQNCGLMIRAAQSTGELINEGKALTHCVGSYADRYAKGETNILFIRKVSEPDKPYYTIEIKNGNIEQIHGKNNRSASEDVSDFIEVFKAQVLNKKTKTKVKIQNKISIPA